MQWLKRLFANFRPQDDSDLSRTMSRLNSRLGLDDDSPRSSAPQYFDQLVVPTRDLARGVVYAPDMDGQAEPGEIVWIQVRTNQDTQERTVIVVGHEGTDLLGLVISCDPSHQNDPRWLEIGSGPWDESGKPAWVRLDRMVRVPENTITRKGAFINRARFERVSHRLRSKYGWS